jgi:hypothetical protein
MTRTTRLSPTLDGLRTPILATGIILVAIGAVLLIYLGMMAIKILNTPEDVRIVQFALENVAVGEKALSGHVGDQEFEVNLSAPVRSVLFLFLGVTLFGVLAGILKSLISGGVKLIRLATGPGEAKPDQVIPGRNPYDQAP